MLAVSLMIGVGRGRGTGSGNWHSSKTVSTEIGEIELSIPRDRRGDFGPVTVPKHERRLTS